MCLSRFLRSIKGIFRLITLINSSINVFISRGVLVSPASITTSLITVNNVYKRMFI